MPDSFLQERLDVRHAKGLLRRLKTYESLIDLTSNDYLGLAKSPLFFQEVARGSTGSRLLTGNSPFIEEVEERVAHYFQAEAALIYSSGYAANVGLISALGREEDALFFDEEIHASAHDGMKLSTASAYPFRHNDMQHLEQRLLRSEKKRKFILVESVYSTNGDLAPLSAISALAERFGAHLIVDEAHAGGVFGAGLAADYKTFARIFAFGKAFGAAGGAVVGSALLREYQINFSRSFIYSTAPSPLFYHAINEALVRVDEPRQKLLDLMLHYGMQAPVRSVFVKDPIIASQELLGAGFFVRALLPPTVKKPCLRLCLHAFNTKDEIDAFWRFLWERKLLLPE